MGEPIVIGGVTIASGDYVLADIDGVVVIPQLMAEELFELLKQRLVRKRICVLHLWQVWIRSMPSKNLEYFETGWN